jgi:hypothetical protein
MSVNLVGESRANALSLSVAVAASPSWRRYTAAYEQPIRREREIFDRFSSK